MQDGHVEVHPIAGAMGARITGVDLSSDMSNQAREAIYQAFLEHQMIFFRDQDLDAARQVNVADILGQPVTYPYLAGVEGIPEAHELIKTQDDEINFGGVWHSDTAYKPEPDKGTVLYACELPDAGGDTLYTNTYLAYETLSGGMKVMIDGLIGVNDSEALYPGGRAGRIANLSEMKDAYNSSSKPIRSEHPVVRTHPETRRKSLFISIAHTLRFKDMAVEESKPLIHYLANHTVRPEFTCRLRWRPGTVAMWDNRCTQHFAVNDYAGQYRRMRRVAIKGDKPF